MSAIDAVFYIAILIMSVVIHEVSHGFMAERYGDKTARLAGRLTLNPLAHLDLFGSVVLPALLFFTTGVAFGWAKPVPYNPNNLTNRRWGTIAVAAAGVLANLFIAIFFGLAIRFAWPFFESVSFMSVMSAIVIINLALALFNLVPIPPLDGSKILFNLLPRSGYKALAFMERYSLTLLIIFVFFFSRYLGPIIFSLFKFITGVEIGF